MPVSCFKNVLRLVNKFVNNGLVDDEANGALECKHFNHAIEQRFSKDVIENQYNHHTKSYIVDSAILSKKRKHLELEEKLFGRSIKW